MTEQIEKKPYVIELSEANMDLLYDALMFIEDYCKDDPESPYTTEDYNDLMYSFEKMQGFQ